MAMVQRSVAMEPHFFVSFYHLVSRVNSLGPPPNGYRSSQVIGPANDLSSFESEAIQIQVNDLDPRPRAESNLFP